MQDRYANCYGLGETNLKILNMTWTGACPLLMHNVRLADPLDSITRSIAEISSKRKKTEDDHLEIARREMLGSLYTDENDKPVIPTDNIHRCMLDAAKKFKLGPSVKSGMLFETADVPLKYQGPRTAGEIIKTEGMMYRRAVVVSRARVIRTRPIFKTWSIDVQCFVDMELFKSKAEIQQIAETAGRWIGLGDWRPKFGRFEVQDLKLAA